MTRCHLPVCHCDKTACFPYSFSFNLGRSASDVGLHFNPRLSENTIVCNSKRSNNWESEQRDGHMCFSPGTEVKVGLMRLEVTNQVYTMAPKISK